jgi:hypothetical protein
VPNSKNNYSVGLELEENSINPAALTEKEFPDFPIPSLAFRSQVTAFRHRFQGFDRLEKGRLPS